MEQRVLNIYTSLSTRTGYRHLEPGEPWTEELGEKITAPGAWTTVEGASTDVGVTDDGVHQVRADVSEAEDTGNEDAEASEAEPETVDPAAAARYASMKKPELQAALEERGLDTGGKVAELLARLVADDAATQ